MKRRILLIIDSVIRLFRRPPRQSDDAFIPKKVLVCRLDHIGDVVMTTPAFRALKEKFPDAGIYVLTNAAGAVLLEKNIFITGIYIFNWPWPYDAYNNRFTGKHIKGMYALIKEIRREKFDLFIDFRGDFRMLLVWGVLTRIPERLFYNRIGGEGLATISVSHSPALHELERVVLTLKALNTPVADLRAEVFLEEAESSTVRQYLSTFCGINNGDPYVVLSPFAAKRVKEWPAAHWKVIARHLRQHHHVTVLMLGTRQNFDEADQMIGHLDGCYNICGKTSLREAAIILSGAKLIVGVDTGTLHLASCFDVPLITLFGPTHSGQYRPYSSFTDLIDLDICICNKDKHLTCNHMNDGYAYCMKEITPGVVMDRIDRLLEKTPLV